MKKMLRHVRFVAVISLLILLMTSPAFAMQPITSISSSEAAQMALYYYCLNRSDDSLVTLDAYEVTPLYDVDGNITYYSVDFFYEGSPKGYVVISEDLNNFLCPEFNYDEASVYYENALNGIETIYYNPFEIFVMKDGSNTAVTLEGELVSEDEIDGTVVPGELRENMAFSESYFVTDDPFTSREMFSEHPSNFLISKNYTSVTSGSVFGTIETAMDNAGAFHDMFVVPSNGSYPVTSTVNLYNDGHCTITAITNVLMYWRSQSFSRYPANYNDLFAVVMNKAISLGHFQNIANGRTPNSLGIQSIIKAVNSNYGYNAVSKCFSTPNATWDRIRSNIDSKRPVILGVSATENTFTYSDHAMILFGYNTVSGWKDFGDYQDYEEYRFIKVYAAHDRIGRGKCYICYDMLEYYANGGLLEYEDANGSTVYIDQDPVIQHEMITFVPY